MVAIEAKLKRCLQVLFQGKRQRREFPQNHNWRTSKVTWTFIFSNNYFIYLTLVLLLFPPITTSLQQLTSAWTDLINFWHFEVLQVQANPGTHVYCHTLELTPTPKYPPMMRRSSWSLRLSTYSGLIFNQPPPNRQQNSRPNIVTCA